MVVPHSCSTIQFPDLWFHELQFTSEDRARFITRANKVSIFEEHGRFTGFQIGAGDPIMLRINDKTAEIVKSGKD